MTAWPLRWFLDSLDAAWDRALEADAHRAYERTSVRTADVEPAPSPTPCGDGAGTHSP